MPDTLESCKKPRNYIWSRGKGFGPRDYTCAWVRVAAPKSSRRSQRRYDVTAHVAQGITARRRDSGSALERLFRDHVERWKSETGHLSSITRMTAHPSYLRIIGMGREGLPLLLKELRENPDHWLVALNAITGEDPALEGASFQEAVTAWTKWGRDKGLC